jgi:hypothetical protein
MNSTSAGIRGAARLSNNEVTRMCREIVFQLQQQTRAPTQDPYPPSISSTTSGSVPHSQFPPSDVELRSVFIVSQKSPGDFNCQETCHGLIQEKIRPQHQWPL